MAYNLQINKILVTLLRGAQYFVGSPVFYLDDIKIYGDLGL